MSDIHGIKKRILDKAIKDKILEKPTKFKCVDCGSKAWCYDHRNYGKPLDVEPVCSGCNFNRGGAKTLKWIRNLARRINEQRKGI